jgi:adenine-specific DNA-methyltransferase
VSQWPAADGEGPVSNKDEGGGSKVAERRRLGAYYTPDDLAGILVEWALAHASGTLLDPAFGGCAFLKAAVRVLHKKGTANAEELVFGVDIDPSCVNNVIEDGRLHAENCLVDDFLHTRPQDLPGAPFEAVVGNPPYVRHHWFNGSAPAALLLPSDHSIKLLRTASSWAYFVVHALGFLRPGGRLAMLVPEAILQANYATRVREVLGASCSETGGMSTQKSSNYFRRSNVLSQCELLALLRQATSAS